MDHPPTDVWIDTDPSIGVPLHDADDGFALIQAFHSPELRVRGLSTTYGNAGLRTTTRIARELARRFGAPAGVNADRVFAGSASLADLGQRTPAAGALAEALRTRPLTYLALAPLTNLASLLQLHPELTGRIEQVIFVGGRSPGRRFRVGPWNPYEFHDSNFQKDVSAARLVLDSKIPLTFVPAELALEVPLTAADLRRIGQEGGEAGRFLAKEARLWLTLWRLVFGIEGGVVFDAFAVLAATHPHLLESERRFASVHADLHGRAVQPGRKRRSYLLATPQSTGEAPGREVTFCTRASSAAKAMILERLAGPSSEAARKARAR